MRTAFCAVGLGVLLTVMPAGTATAATVDAAMQMAKPQNELARITGTAEQPPEHALWQVMANAGSGEWRPGNDLWAMGTPRTITAYTDPADYEAAVGEHETISFAEAWVSPGEVLYDQYVDQGVIFADGAVPGGGDDDVVLQNVLFVIDDVGANGNGGFELEFTQPQTHMGVDFPGGLAIELYDGDDLVWSSEAFGGAGSGFFAGVVLSEDEGTFDRAVLTDPVDGFAFIDNLRYDVVPEPTTFALLGLGCLSLARWGGRGRKLR